MPRSLRKHNEICIRLFVAVTDARDKLERSSCSRRSSCSIAGQLPRYGSVLRQNITARRALGKGKFYLVVTVVIRKLTENSLIGTPQECLPKSRCFATQYIDDQNPASWGMSTHGEVARARQMP